MKSTLKKQSLIFDNSNLNESYAGVTTPLTFSFARRAYKTVYEEFSRVIGVPEKIIKKNEPMYEAMIAFICGRMYYNLLNWYRLISLIPGYSFNRGFFEKMLGVSKELRYDPREKYPWQGKIIEFILLLKQIIKISFEFVTLNNDVKNFLRGFDKEFRKLNSFDLTTFSDQKLLEFYLSTEKKFSTKWRITIVNDLATMIATGIARRMAAVWLDDKEDILLNRYLANVKNLESTKPGEKLTRILLLIKNDKAFSKLFQNNSDVKILNSLLNGKKFLKLGVAINKYLKDFGERSPNELKLESKTYTDNPRIFITLIKNQLSAVTGKKIDFEKKPEEELQIKEKIKDLSPIKKLLFRFAIKQSQDYIRNREAARLKRSQIFGFARKVLKEFGRRMARYKFINKEFDIFYLTVEETIGIFNGTLIQKNLALLIRERREEFNRWSKIEVPGRIKIVNSTFEFESQKLAELKTFPQKGYSVKKDLKGLTCSVGLEGDKVCGEALVMKIFNENASFVDKILVAKQTDPGWTLIFPYLKGVIVERGGMLSHAAIVAREYGIPCISAVEKATDIIPNGGQVTLNVKTGTINFSNQ